MHVLVKIGPHKLNQLRLYICEGACALTLTLLHSRRRNRRHHDTPQSFHRALSLSKKGSKRSRTSPNWDHWRRIFSWGDPANILRGPWPRARCDVGTAREARRPVVLLWQGKRRDRQFPSTAQRFFEQFSCSLNNEGIPREHSSKCCIGQQHIQ